MTDRPILYSGPMVRAMLEGRKTQTRRVLSPDNFRLFDPSYGLFKPVKSQLNRAFLEASNMRCLGEGSFTWTAEAVEHQIGDITHWQGKTLVTPGDRLWVREAHQMANSDDGPTICYRADLGRWQPDYTGPDHGAGPSFDYDKYPGEYGVWAADLESDDSPWRPSIHMPRWCSRITVTVTDVRVQRLTEISESDAKAEGCDAIDLGRSPYLSNAHKIDFSGMMSFTHGFHRLWDSLNQKRGFGWHISPWVATYTFTVHKQNIDQMEPA